MTGTNWNGIDKLVFKNGEVKSTFEDGQFSFTGEQNSKEHKLNTIFGVLAGENGKLDTKEEQSYAKKLYAIFGYGNYSGNKDDKNPTGLSDQEIIDVLKDINDVSQLKKKIDEFNKKIYNNTIRNQYGKNVSDAELQEALKDGNFENYQIKDRETLWKIAEGVVKKLDTNFANKSKKEQNAAINTMIAKINKMNMEQGKPDLLDKFNVGQTIKTIKIPTAEQVTATTAQVTATTAQVTATTAQVTATTAQVTATTAQVTATTAQVTATTAQVTATTIIQDATEAKFVKGEGGKVTAQAEMTFDEAIAALEPNANETRKTELKTKLQAKYPNGNVPKGAVLDPKEFVSTQNRPQIVRSNPPSEFVAPKIELSDKAHEVEDEIINAERAKQEWIASVTEFDVNNFADIKAGAKLAANTELTDQMTCVINGGDCELQDLKGFDHVNGTKTVTEHKFKADGSIELVSTDKGMLTPEQKAELTKNINNLSNVDVTSLLVKSYDLGLETEVTDAEGKKLTVRQLLEKDVTTEEEVRAKNAALNTLMTNITNVLNNMKKDIRLKDKSINENNEVIKDRYGNINKNNDIMVKSPGKAAGLASTNAEFQTEITNAQETNMQTLLDLAQLVLLKEKVEELETNIKAEQARFNKAVANLDKIKDFQEKAEAKATYRNGNEKINSTTESSRLDARVQRQENASTNLQDVGKDIIEESAKGDVTAKINVQVNKSVIVAKKSEKTDKKAVQSKIADNNVKLYDWKKAYHTDMQKPERFRIIKDEEKIIENMQNRPVGNYIVNVVSTGEPPEVKILRVQDNYFGNVLLTEYTGDDVQRFYAGKATEADLNNIPLNMNQNQMLTSYIENHKPSWWNSNSKIEDVKDETGNIVRKATINGNEYIGNKAIAEALSLENMPEKPAMLTAQTELVGYLNNSADVLVQQHIVDILCPADGKNTTERTWWAKQFSIDGEGEAKKIGFAGKKYSVGDFVKILEGNPQLLKKVVDNYAAFKAKNPELELVMEISEDNKIIFKCGGQQIESAENIFNELKLDLSVKS